MRVQTFLGKYTASAHDTYDGALHVWDVTIYDRDDTSIVYHQQHEMCSERMLIARIRNIIRTLSAAQVASYDWDAIHNGPRVVGVVYEADIHCLYCTRDEHGRDAITRVIATQVDNLNVVELLDAGYPVDREGNALTRYTVDEAWENYYQSQDIAHCGGCCIALIDKHEAWGD